MHIILTYLQKQKFCKKEIFFIRCYKGYVLLLFLLFIPIFLYAQQNKINYDYIKYKQEFYKQISKLHKRNTNIPKEVLKVEKVKLPGNFFETVHTNRNSIIVFGISDPGLDSISAFRQAYYRALAEATLLYSSFIQCKTDNFKEEYKTEGQEDFSKFVIFNKLQGESYFDTEAVQQGNSQLLSSGEALVRLCIKKLNTESRGDIHVKTWVNNYIEERNHKDNTVIQSKMDWSYYCYRDKHLQDSGFFQTYSLNNNITWRSTENSIKHASDSLDCHYIYTGISDTLPDFTEHYNVTGGLWNAFSRALVNEMILKSLNLSGRVRISQLSDYYSKKNISLSSTQESREFRFYIKEINISDKALSIQLSER